MTDADLVALAARLWLIPVDHLVGPDIGRPCRIPNAVAARQAVAWTLHVHRNRSSRQIGALLNVAHTTVLRSEPADDPRLRDLEWAAMQGDTDE